MAACDRPRTFAVWRGLTLVAAVAATERSWLRSTWLRHEAGWCLRRVAACAGWLHLTWPGAWGWMNA